MPSDRWQDSLQFRIWEYIVAAFSLQALRVLKVCSDIIRNRWSFSHSLALTQHPRSIIFCFLSTLFNRSDDVDTTEKSLVRRGICKGDAAPHKTAFHIPPKRTQWGFLREGKRETMCVWRYGQPTWSGQWNAQKNTVWWSFSYILDNSDAGYCL